MLIILMEHAILFILFTTYIWLFKCEYVQRCNKDGLLMHLKWEQEEG